MNFQLHSRIRTGVAALGVIAGLSMPAAATPLAGASRAAIQPAAAPSVEFEQVNHRYRCYYGGCGYNYWNDDWRYRYYRPYRRHYSGLYFSFGVPGFQYYAPSYRYYDPPRRYYRRGGGHVAWCYDRYRSYREWDNTWKPYYGPRRQCWSPYR
jgi:hypothetical protein